MRDFNKEPVDLSDVKVGDEAFHSYFGGGTVTAIKTTISFNAFDYGKWGNFGFCGFDTRGGDQPHPSLFHTPQECAEYFAWVAAGSISVPIPMYVETDDEELLEKQYSSVNCPELNKKLTLEFVQANVHIESLKRMQMVEKLEQRIEALEKVEKWRKENGERLMGYLNEL